MSDLNNVSSDPIVTEINVTDVAMKKRTLRKRAFTSIKLDLTRNPRLKGVYTAEHKECIKVARSIWKYGLQTPLVVNIRDNGECWMLQGHRRWNAINLIRTVGIPADKDNEAIPATPGFMSEVECMTYTGLTLTEEMDLVMDHGNTLLLNEQEKTLAAIQMTGVGFTHNMIADKLGMSRSNYTNGIGKLIQLPDFIVAAALETDPEKVKTLPSFTQPVIKELFASFADDKKAGGIKLNTAGPKLLAKWEEIKATGAAPTVKTLARSGIEKLATGLSGATDQDIIDLLQGILDGNAQNAGAAINRLKISLRMAGDTVGTDRQTIEEGIVKPIVNEEYTALVNGEVV